MAKTAPFDSYAFPFRMNRWHKQRREFRHEWMGRRPEIAESLDNELVMIQEIKEARTPGGHGIMWLAHTDKMVVIDIHPEDKGHIEDLGYKFGTGKAHEIPVYTMWYKNHWRLLEVVEKGQI